MRVVDAQNTLTSVTERASKKETVGGHFDIWGIVEFLLV